MRDFITCLEFLTRIRFSHRTDWRDEDFSRSVPYFPLVGLVIGAFLGAVNYGLVWLAVPDFMRAALLILAEIIITGGLMYDGFMDTADGVFSARNRERMLEIMKDSHVGSNAVLAVVTLILLKVAAYVSIMPQELTAALIAMSGVCFHHAAGADGGADCHERGDAHFYGNFYRQLPICAQNRHWAHV